MATRLSGKEQELYNEILQLYAHDKKVALPQLFSRVRRMLEWSSMFTSKILKSLFDREMLVWIDKPRGLFRPVENDTIQDFAKKTSVNRSHCDKDCCEDVQFEPERLWRLKRIRCFDFAIEVREYLNAIKTYLTAVN